MNPITLRRARAADAEDFARMMSAPEVFGGVIQMPYADADYWRTRLGESRPAASAELHLVALVDSAVVGSAGLHAVSTMPRRRHAMSLGITVARDHQGQGVGRALMGALCDYADRWAGVLRIELTVYADNHRAIALYRRFGFLLEGTHRAYALRDGVYVDALAMARLHPHPPALPDPESVQDAVEARATAVAGTAAAEPWPREIE